MSQYAAVVGDDETKYALAERSTERLRKIQQIRMRSLSINEQKRRELAQQWSENPADVFDPDEEPKALTPDVFYRRAFEVLAAGLDEPDDVTDAEDSEWPLDPKKDVRFSVVEEMIQDFLPTRRAVSNGVSGLSNVLKRLAERSQAET